MNADAQLRANLITVHAISDTEPFDKELARRAIIGSDLEMVVCQRPTGWPSAQCAMFGRLFQWCYHETLSGKKWKPKAKTA